MYLSHLCLSHQSLFTLYLSHRLLSPFQDSAVQASQQRHLPKYGCKVKTHKKVKLVQNINEIKNIYQDAETFEEIGRPGILARSRSGLP